MINRRSLIAGIAIVAVIVLALIGYVLVRSDGAKDRSTGSDVQPITHAQGTTHVPTAPRTIVVFDVATLDTLDHWGVAAAGVPTGRYPAYLARYDSGEITRVGTLFEPDYEAVNALRPDLIIVAGRSAAKYAELSRIAPTVDLTVDQNDYVASSLRNIATLGLIFDKQEEAARDTAEIRRKIAALRVWTATAGDALVVLTTGGRMSAYGPGSRFGVLHSEFGFAPARPNLEVSNHGEGVNAEFVLETDPDWLMVVDRDAATAQGSVAARQVMNNELIARTKAARNGRVVYLDPMSWYIVTGGVRSLETIVDQLSEAIDATGPADTASGGVAPAA